MIDMLYELTHIPFLAYMDRYASKFENAKDIVMIDVDDFKQINDRNSHLFEDAPLDHIVSVVGGAYDTILPRFPSASLILSFLKNRFHPHASCGRQPMKKKSVLFSGILYLLFFIITLCITLCPTTAFAAERETIRVGFFAFDGYHEIDENGMRSGYGYDFLRLVSRYLNVNFEYVGYENSWSDMLERGEIDLVTSAQATPDRMQTFDLSKSIGSSSAMLTTRIDNTAIKVHNYDTYDGIHIGILRGNSRNEDLAVFAEKNGFSYIPVYFDLHTELEDALQSGAVDAALTSSLRKTVGEQVLDTFANQDFYVMVRKGDTELLQKINYAIDQLNATEGDWQNDLDSKYYTRAQDRNISFTDTEKEIIRQYASGEKTLVVSACLDKAPYAYAENGEAKGILFDYFDILAEYAGIPYTTLVTADREEYLRLCDNGEVDICLDGRYQCDSQAEDLNITPSAPYTTMRLAMVTRRDFSGNINKIAVTNHSGPFAIESGLAPDAERVYMDNRVEGMQAVLDGEVDATFVYLYAAQQFINQDTHGQLTYTLVNSISYPYSLSVCENAPYELAGIFTKCIYVVPEDTLELIAARYTSYQASDIDLWTLIELYPYTAMLFLGIVFFTIFLAFILFQRHKSAKIAKERAALYQELAMQAEKANSAKSRFLANVSHDIRTPMNAIVGISTLMENETDLSDRMRDYVRKLRLSSRYLLGLINDILDMSRIESQEIGLNRESFCIVEQIAQVENIIHLQAAQRDQQFDIQLKTFCHTDLLGDAVRLRQILQNLLSNAVKYTPNGGKICLEVEELCCDDDKNTTFRFVVTDNGIGMSREFLDHIFEPFARNEDSVVNKTQGTGLGMAITKNIVDLMSGDIQIISEPGKGTTVILTLGMEIDREASYHADVDTVLLVTEDAFMRKNLEGYFQKTNAALTVTRTPEEASEQLQKQDFDLVLLSSNGSSLKLKEKIICLQNFISGQTLIFVLGRLYTDRESERNDALEQGADGLVPHPFRFSELNQELAKVRIHQNTSHESCLHGKRFLCAEDNELNAEILEALLETKGASCTIYPDGSKLVEAFESVAFGEYAAILMDVQMPNMNGLEAARAIRASKNPLGKSIPIIAMTANAFTEDVQQSLNAGMNAHISKPIDIEIIEKIMRRHIACEKEISKEIDSLP